MSTGRGWVMTPEDKVAALKEAKSRGLPDGWSVELDKRKRRKWIAPNNRSCDSIPKALAISVELGMLPADTVLPTSQPKRKRGRPPSSKMMSKSNKLKNRKKPGRKPGRKPKIALDLTKDPGNEMPHDTDDDDDDTDDDEDDDDESESEDEEEEEIVVEVKPKKKKQVVEPPNKKYKKKPKNIIASKNKKLNNDSSDKKN